MQTCYLALNEQFENHNSSLIPSFPTIEARQAWQTQEIEVDSIFEICCQPHGHPEHESKDANDESVLVRIANPMSTPAQVLYGHLDPLQLSYSIYFFDSLYLSQSGT